jgi:hypothetical protein
MERSYQGDEKAEWGGMAHSIPPNLNVSTLVLKNKTLKTKQRKTKNKIELTTINKMKKQKNKTENF